MAGSDGLGNLITYTCRHCQRQYQAYQKNADESCNNCSGNHKWKSDDRSYAVFTRLMNEAFPEPEGEPEAEEVPQESVSPEPKVYPTYHQGDLIRHTIWNVVGEVTSAMVSLHGGQLLSIVFPLPYNLRLLTSKQDCLEKVEPDPESFENYWGC